MIGRAESKRSPMSDRWPREVQKHNSAVPDVAMNGDTVEQGSLTQPRSWKEFCELHAHAAARELARQYLLFANENPNHDIQGAEKFSSYFTDLFQQYFRNEVKEGFVMNRCSVVPFTGVQDYRETGRKNPDGSSGLVLPKMEAEVNSAEASERGSDTHLQFSSKARSSEDVSISACPSLERPKALTQFTRTVGGSIRGLFRRKSADSTVIERKGGASAVANSPEKEWLKNLTHKFTRSRTPSKEEVHDIRKEDILNYMVVDDVSMDVGTRWQKCRLLVRRAKSCEGDEYILELFDPPKCSKPKHSTPCSAITEIRTCTQLEMPDNVNTFVLKILQIQVKSYLEVIFEAVNDQQLNLWTTNIRECINPWSERTDVELLPTPRPSIVQTGTVDGTTDSIHQGAAHHCASEQPYHKTDQLFSSYAWFHGPISRFKAAQLVQIPGTEGHGVFLVRQSETQRGEYVLTFNYRGRAKHLRLLVTETGKCFVQHFRFPSVTEMLNYFGTFAIPLECGTTCEVKLSSYVVAIPSQQGSFSPSSALVLPFSVHRSNSEPNLAHLGPSSCNVSETPQAGPEQVFHTVPPSEESFGGLRRSGSVVVPTRHQRDSDYDMESAARGHSRAIDNQYMFL
ncbi:SH2B adapter protein 3 isoform X1 [Pristis pectinata]|uniref:SH2B adapter protein 3 isoform X1 n=2 Tax=Pristis pectinata TaxID=685728 RepID=UPI00223E3DAC|nr:SH2B adapter protein 3 isoform X1 [Pristis pectinata]